MDEEPYNPKRKKSKTKVTLEWCDWVGTMVPCAPGRLIPPPSPVLVTASLSMRFHVSTLPLIQGHSLLSLHTSAAGISSSGRPPPEVTPRARRGLGC